MLVFSLQKVRYRLPICLLVLVIGTGLLPKKSRAVKCYSCDGPDCLYNFKDKTDETGPECTSDHCKWLVNKTATRSCTKHEYAKCYVLLKGGCPSVDHNDPGWEKFEKCLHGVSSGSFRKGKERTDYGDYTTYCFCKGALCNDGKDPTVIPDISGGNHTPPKPSASTGTGGETENGSHIPSNNDTDSATGGTYAFFNTFGVLLFAILGIYVS